MYIKFGGSFMRIKDFIKNTKEALTIKPFHSSSLSSVEQHKQNQSLATFVLASVAVILAFEPSIAAATTSNIETAAATILTAITGPLGRTVATIAVVVLGMMAMFGKLAWDMAIKVILGIAIMFGAASVVDWISGGMSVNVAA